MKLNKLHTKNAFTLLEILIWITIFSIIITSWFYAFSAVWVWKIKLIWKTEIEKESYFFSEKLFEEIKKGWVIDYEEYFNRMVINSWNIWDEYWSWHYKHETGFWNYWSGWIIWTNSFWDYFYYCRSSDTTSMWTWWCYNTNFNTYWNSVIWKPQRFWQYSFQFVDYNSNINNDFWLIWDENADGNIVWDDDDENIWIWPEVITSSGKVQELYLISWDKKTRTFFRWAVYDDPNKPNTASWCDFSNQSSPEWDWCLWTIEFLKTNLKDWWVDHNKSWQWLFDWTPETWIINPAFCWSWSIIAGSNLVNYRVPLFPKTINVKNVSFYLYPSKDLNYAWKDSNTSTNFSPYLRIKYSLSPSREKRKWIKWKIPELNFSTSISLSDLFSQK